MIFDSHAHYDDESFNEDRDKVIDEIRNNGVMAVLNCGSSVEGARASVELSKKYDFIYSAIGVHPEFADKLNEEILKEFEETYYDCKKVKAIGEIGLDYHCDENPPREIQKRAFISQMELAEKLRLPVVIHDREAHKDTLEIIKQFPNVIGTIHCFSGSNEFAMQCLNLGYYIGFTGVVTFKNAKKILDVLKVVPLDRILVETDCPYMAPTPYRGKRNRSDYIKYSMEIIAKIKGISLEEAEYNTVRNAKKLLNLK